MPATPPSGPVPTPEPTGAAAQPDPATSAPTRAVRQPTPARDAAEPTPGGAHAERRTDVPDPLLEPGAAPSRGELVGAALRAWRGELAATGGPNALLWYQDSAHGTLDLTAAHPTGVSMLMAGNTVLLSHLVREPTAFRVALERARRIREKAAELRGDHGLDTLFVCIGMATWSLPGTHRRPAAPLMLRPVRLHAFHPAEADLELQLSPRVELNPVLLHYMRSEQGVRLDGEALADLAHSSGRFDPLPVYREVQRLLAGVPGVTLQDRRVLSTFAPTKMAMVADLGAFAGLLTGNDLIAALAGDGDAAQSVRADGDAGLAESGRRPVDDDLSREVLVLDADVSQADVVATARSGRHVLVDAARGTGATQTLANVAAALVGSDQRVLLISENARQLDDVIDHLGRAGLAELVLDARDPHALRTTLAAGTVARLEGAAGATAAASGPDADPGVRGAPSDGDTPEKALARLRGRLIAHVDCLHVAREPWRVSVFDAQGALVRLSAQDDPPMSRVRIPADALRTLTPGERDRVVADITDLARAGAWTEQPDDDDPWWGARVPQDQSGTGDAQIDGTPSAFGDIPGALELAGQLVAGRLAADRAALDACLADVGLPPARTPHDWDLALGLIREVRETLSVLQPTVYDHALDSLIDTLDPQAQPRPSWWARQSARKEARVLVLPHARVDSLHAELGAAREQRRKWGALTGGRSTPAVPEQYDAAVARWAALLADLSRLERTLSGTRAGGGLLTADLDAVHDRLAGLTARSDRAAVLPAVAWRLDALASAGLGALLDDFALRHLPAERVAAEVEFVWWRSLLELVAEEDPTYGGFDGAALRDLAAEYAAADRRLLQDRAGQILARARAHARVEASTHPDQVEALRAAAAPGRRPRALRPLLAESGDVVAAVSPIWVMSPLVLASVVPTHLGFDAVLIDDAGRMPLAHAVSALARSVRVVAAGDLQGLGPRPFDTLAGPDEVDGPDQVDQQGVDRPVSDSPASDSAGSDRPGSDSSASDSLASDSAGSDRHGFDRPGAPVGGVTPDAPTGPELSVLAALAQHLPVRHLQRAYGDRDAHLACLASAHRTDRVTAWPRAGRGGALRLLRTGVGLSAADAPTDSLSRENARVVEAVLEHARSRPHDSLAVLAPTAAQAAQLRAEVREALAADSTAAGAAVFAETTERLLITTVDRAAGHSRDAVVFATGVEVLPESQVQLPPRLRRPDGDRVIAEVAGITRSRLTVVSALTARDLARVESVLPGHAALADLLATVERHGHPAENAPDGTATQHALLAELAGRLRTEGLVVHEGYGEGRDRLDLAIEDPYVPGRLAVAVVSDGQRYAALGGVRERERLLPEQLVARGWRVTRVWSTDVFRDPARDVARLLDVARAGRADSDGDERSASKGAPKRAPADQPVSATAGQLVSPTADQPVSATDEPPAGPARVSEDGAEVR